MAASYARFVVVGGDGVRLHEEVLHAGGWVRRDGRSARVESFARIDAQLAIALARGLEVPSQFKNRLAGGWNNTERGLFLALERRAQDRYATLTALLQRRQAEEQARITDNLNRFAQTLQGRLDTAKDVDSDLALFAANLADPTESAQMHRDQEAWRRRLQLLPAELEAELQHISARYANPADHLFPVAVVFVVPKREVIR